MKNIGRYTVLGLLGRGGMGAVYKAAMPRTGRVVALKLLRPSEQLAATADMDALRRGFYREAQLMASIRHPGVAQVLDVDEDAQGCPFFVMEYYCNNLGAQLGEGYRVEEPTRRLGVEQSLSVARQLACALARLHHEGILHRDVKPYNLMLADRPADFAPVGGASAEACSGDEVKLIDFGLSRLRGETEPGRPRGAVVGSPYYAAPEQEADPARADERADVFSAGVTLFRCLTGRLPQEGAPASSLRQGLDARFDAFFARCCHERPAARPASARELLAELDGLAAHWNRLREAACALPPEAGGSEAGALEAGLPDADLQGFALSDAGLLGGNVPDRNVSGGGAPGGNWSDGNPPHGNRLDGTLPGGSLPGGTLPGENLPEESLPEETLPEKNLSGPQAAKPQAGSAARSQARLRGQPLRQSLAGARERFGLDELWRPAACLPQRFRDQGDGTVRDALSGLVWERGGSPYAVNFSGAQAHADRLNGAGFAGLAGWRLPTVDELATLLLPEPDLRRLCLAGVFDPALRRLWSADRKSYMAAWYADVEHGFVWWQDATCEFFARCVTSGR